MVSTLLNNVSSLEHALFDARHFIHHTTAATGHRSLASHVAGTWRGRAALHVYIDTATRQEQWRRPLPTFAFAYVSAAGGQKAW